MNATDLILSEFDGFPGYCGNVPTNEKEFSDLFGKNNPWENKPTWSEVEEKVNTYLFNKKINDNKSLRQAAYVTESDPIFFKYQRGEATKEEWLIKIEEIKNRYS